MPTRRRRIDWDQYADLFGTMTDAKVAARIGCTSTAVCAARKARGIPPYPQPTIDWPTHAHLLGTMADCDLAKRLGCATTSVFKARTARSIPPFHNVAIDWTRWSNLLRSPTRNADIAAQIGCAKESVRLRRHRLGITREPVDWDAQAHLFGTMPDSAVAARLNRARTTVGQERRKRGIPPYQP